MTTSFAQPILQVFDDYGVILAGGKIETFAAGTTTPLATYQDLDGDIANTNPVVLDSAGKAVIRLTDGVAYKFDIYDSDDNLLDTIDDIVVGASNSASGQAYLVHMTFEGTPGAQGYMGGHIFTDTVQFPIDFDGGIGAVETNPGSDFIISVRKNGVEVGTATISNAGAFTFASTSHAVVNCSSGDRLTFVGPSSVGTAADFCMALEGTVQ